jgi:hypothetical protein
MNYKSNRANLPVVEVKPPSEAASPDLHNTNKHTQRGRGLHENSMRKRGAFRSIASAGKGVSIPVVYAGNQTLEIAAQLGMEVINVHTNGNQVVNVVRDDIAPGSVEAIALGLEDNEIAKQSYNPDLEILAAVMADPAMQALKDEDKLLAGLVKGMGGDLKIQSLDALAEEYGEPTAEDFWPFIKIQVSVEIKEKFDKVMLKMSGSNEMEKFDALISSIKLS